MSKKLPINHVFFNDSSEQGVINMRHFVAKFELRVKFDEENEGAIEEVKFKGVSECQ